MILNLPGRLRIDGNGGHAVFQGEDGAVEPRGDEHVDAGDQCFDLGGRPQARGVAVQTCVDAHHGDAAGRQQLLDGGVYHELRPSIGICLLDAIEFRGEVALHHSFELRTEGGLSLTDCLRIHLFELPKYVPPSDNRVIGDMPGTTEELLALGGERLLAMERDLQQRLRERSG